VCALLDVPLRDGGGGASRALLEGLHHLFLLLLDFRDNPFFQRALGDGGASGVEGAGTGPPGF
jgi:hypothetical protein